MTGTTAASTLERTLEELRSTVAGLPGSTDASIRIGVSRADDDPDRHNYLHEMRRDCSTSTPATRFTFTDAEELDRSTLCPECLWEDVMVLNPEATSRDNCSSMVNHARRVLDWISGAAPQDWATSRSATTAASSLAYGWSPFSALAIAASAHLDALLDESLLEEYLAGAAELACLQLDEGITALRELGVDGTALATAAAKARAELPSAGWAVVDVPDTRDIDPVAQAILARYRVGSGAGDLYVLPAVLLVQLRDYHDGSFLTIRGSVTLPEKPSVATLEALGVLYAPTASGAFTSISDALAAAEAL